MKFLIKSHLFSCQRQILVVDLDKINLEDDPDTIIHLRLLAWHSKSKKNKTLKKR